MLTETELLELPEPEKSILPTGHIQQIINLLFTIVRRNIFFSYMLEVVQPHGLSLPNGNVVQGLE